MAWLGIGILVLFALLYVRLLFGPISLAFLSDRVKAEIAGVVEENYSVDWRDFGLSLTGPVSIGFHLSTVTLTERATGAVVTMDALEIEISPIGALLGRPNARIILVRPAIQMLQNLFGPHISRFEFIEDPATGEALVRVLEGHRTAPVVEIGDEGISLGAQNGEDIDLQSDNDRLVSNVEALDDALAGLADQAMAGQIRRFEIRDGTIGVLDTVYGRYRSFEAVDLEVRSGIVSGRVRALFDATVAGNTMNGSIVRQVEDGVPQIDARIENIDFSAIVPFLDDSTALAAVKGAGGLGLAVRFGADGQSIQTGRFAIDLTGTSLRINNDLFPIDAEPAIVDWHPSRAQFSIAETEIAIGQSRATVTGDLAMGFDKQFGPVLGISVRARDVWLHPNDLDAPREPFEEVSFEGWSSPLYGALGIDRMVVAKPDASMVMRGRFDMVRQGVGMDVTLSGRGASADDVKRLWPYIFAREGREWFTEYVTDGTIDSAEMHFDFPVGTVDMEGKGGPVPDGSMSINLVGNDVHMLPFEELPQFELEGETRLTMSDNQLTVAMDRAILPAYGDIAVSNAAYINQDTSADEQIFEVSGDLTGSAAAVLRLANSEAVGLFANTDFDLDLKELAETIDGTVESTIIATIGLDDIGEVASTDYALNGTITGLASSEPIAGFEFSEGGFSFTASQRGFNVQGTTLVGDTDVHMRAVQTPGNDPEILIGATLDVEDAAEFGVDLSGFMGGTARVTARPAADGEFEIAADLTDTALTISDIGIAKPRGQSGSLTATLALGEEEIAVSDVALSFGTVRLEGGFALSPEGELLSADFPVFRVSAGDSAQVAMTPITGGYAFDISGQQLDLKPVLRRFFDLSGDDSAGASENLQDQLFNVNVNLERALGYYGEAAFNVDLDLSVRGEELRRVDLAAQFSENRSASAATNPLPSGRIISYATNDLGAMLRFTGVYPRLVGGEGSMVMRYDAGSETDTGQFLVRSFAIADESNLDAIVGQHEASQQRLNSTSALEFDMGRAEFVRHPNRIEVVEAAVYGDTVGGTIRGNVFTEAGRYDLAGTYVPLFGLNNFFQQIPVLGPIFGGREGEGLIGVTFAVRGPLDAPDLLVNPVSILAPGVFRSLFEFRARP